MSEEISPLMSSILVGIIIVGVDFPNRYGKIFWICHILKIGLKLKKKTWKIMLGLEPWYSSRSVVIVTQ